MEDFIRISGSEKSIEVKVSGNGACWLSYPALETTGMVKHGFSTREGGVSRGFYESMNLSFSRGDDREAVLKNYELISEAIGIDRSSVVLTHQTHTTDIRLVSREDIGKGISKDRDYTDIDGLICNQPGITLAAFFADCIPLYFVDRDKRAIGLAHSGWRGTVAGMGGKMLKAMNENFGSLPEDMIACIGPGICGSCYEVGDELYKKFDEDFEYCSADEIFKTDSEGRYRLDLLKANRIMLETRGVLPENIHVADICTHCNPKLMFSHRAHGDKRGNMAAFLSLK